MKISRGKVKIDLFHLLGVLLLIWIFSMPTPQRKAVLMKRGDGTSIRIIDANKDGIADTVISMGTYPPPARTPTKEEQEYFQKHK